MKNFMDEYVPLDLSNWRVWKMKVELLHALNGVAASLQQMATHSEEEVFCAFSQQIVELGLRGAIGLLDETGQRIVIRAITSSQALEHLEELTGLKAIGFAFDAAQVDAYRQVMETGETIFIADNSPVIAQMIPKAARPFTGHIIETFGSMPAIYAPIVAEGQVRGVLHVMGESLAPDDTPAVEAFANHIAVALHNVVKQAESEEQLRKLSSAVEQIPTSVMITDADGVIEYVNPEFTRITGYSLEEVIGKTPRILNSGVHPPEFFEELWHTIKSGKEWQGDICNRKKSGELYWELQSISPIRNPEGEISHFLAVRIDDTERKRAEEKLKAKTRQQAAVAELGQHALAGMDLSTLMDEATATVAQTLEVEYAKVLELLPSGDALLLRAGVGWQEGLVGQATVNTGVDSQAGYTLSVNEPVIVEDLRTETRFNGSPLLCNHGVVSGVSVVIQGRDRPLGVLGAHTVERRTFTQDDIHFLQAIANVLATAIERKQWEEALQESEGRFRQVISSISDHIYMTEMTEEGERVNRYVSPNVEALTGYPVEKFTADWGFWQSLIHPDDREVAAAQVMRFLAGQNSEVEYRMIRANGETIWVRDSGRVMVRQNGDRQIITVYGVVSDITQRKQAEEEVHLLQTMTQAIDEAQNFHLALKIALCKVCEATGWDFGEAWIPRPDGTVLEYSPAWCSSTESLEKFRQLSETFVFLPGVGLPGRVWASGQTEWIPDVSAGPDTFFLRAQIALEAGLKAGLGVPIIADGQVLAVLVFFMFESRQEDRPLVKLISAIAAQLGSVIRRKRAEEEIRRRNRELTLLNRVIAASVASPEPEEVLETACRELAWAFDVPQAAAALLNDQKTEAVVVAEYLAEGRPPALGKTIPVKGNPSFQYLLTHKAPLAVDDAQHDPRLAPIHDLMRQRGTISLLILPLVIEGEVVGSLGLDAIEPRPFLAEEISLAWSVADQVAGVLARARLVEERRQLEEQYHQAQKMEAVGRLTAGIAHDFNNLLTAINGFAELLQLQLSPYDPAHELVSKIRSSGRRAADLIRQLLAFSRKQIIAPQVLDLNAVVVEMDRMLRRIIGEDIELETILAPELWPVEADPAQMEQVIVNLVVNARDAMPEGGRLTIETTNVVIDKEHAAGHLETKPGEHVQLVISDTGVGMSPEVLAHIFEPFFTTKGMGKGTGLGLATVYGIVRQSGGDIWVYSEEGRGTTFRIYLPRASGVAQPLPHPEAGKEMPSGGETILLVEDDRDVRELAQRVLQRQGYTVLEARDGREAMRLATSHSGPIHLLLTDVVMPGISGMALADRLTADRPDIKVLFMSGYTDNAIAHHGVLDPGITLLQKPFSPMDLARRVRALLDK